MAPVTQYVFAEMLGISELFTAGSHEWLPYSVIPTFPKLICKHQFIAPRRYEISPTALPWGILYWVRFWIHLPFFSINAPMPHFSTSVSWHRMYSGRMGRPVNRLRQ